MAEMQRNPSSPNNKPTVIGIYGLSGSGKTTLLRQLEHELGQEHFAFFDSSKVIDTVTPGGLTAFKKLSEQDKTPWRQIALQTVRDKCTAEQKVAVVAGHYKIWDNSTDHEKGPGQVAWTQTDADIYTHMLYLDVSPEKLREHIWGDIEVHRPFLPVELLRRRQEEEKTQLRNVCRDHRILFSLVPESPKLFDKALALVRDFQIHSENYNRFRAKRKLDDLLFANPNSLERVLVMDGDKTLAAEDTGVLFWEAYFKFQQSNDQECPLNTLFGQLGYSHFAFRQAALLYEEIDNKDFDSLCEGVASTVTVYPEFVSLLNMVANQEHVRAVIVTSGLRYVWEQVVKRNGLSETVKVIGGGRLVGDFVVTAEMKEALVTHLQERHGMHVWAFGDSALDLPMLRKANQAVVVLGDEETRSRSMDNALRDAIDNDNTFKPYQSLLPSNVSPRLDDSKLPQIDITGYAFTVEADLNRHIYRREHQIFDATGKMAAQLLATPTRNADVGGPALREYHRRIGHYLAIEFLPEVIGVEKCPVRHVLGRRADGIRLFREQQTMIVAMMRGGEPMALGVNDALPLAMFVHAKNPRDIQLHHLKGQVTVLLVDSVVNSGESMVQFVEHVRNLHATIRIVMVVAVTQAGVISGGGRITEMLSRHANLTLVTLRHSETSFVGSGTNDTGNRLFNTTHLD